MEYRPAFRVQGMHETGWSGYGMISQLGVFALWTHPPATACPAPAQKVKTSTPSRLSQRRGGINQAFSWMLIFAL
jgi:hypothetical protein